MTTRRTQKFQIKSFMIGMVCHSHVTRGKGALSYPLPPPKKIDISPFCPLKDPVHVCDFLVRCILESCYPKIEANVTRQSRVSEPKTKN